MRGTEPANRKGSAWEAGDYQPLVEALGFSSIGSHLVAQAGVEPAMTVLDVAAGTGNVARAAAVSGARVFALDNARRLLDSGRGSARSDGLGVHWVKGDAEALPFPDGAFDRVLSCLGVMFVDDGEQAASELVRVCRPGGVIALAHWTPGGLPGRISHIMNSYRLDGHGECNCGHNCSGGCGGSGGDGGPSRWGTADGVAKLFAPEPVTLEFELGAAPVSLGLAGDYMELLAAHAGPVSLTRKVLESQGRWAGLSAEVERTLEPANETPGRAWTARQEYLLAVATKIP